MLQSIVKGFLPAALLRACLIFPLLSLLASCSLFKLDKESNCLNDKAACFKSDKTAPQLAAGGDVYPKQDQLVSVLNYIDVMFSEELNNPQPADFSLTGAGQDLEITSVQLLSGYTYRLMVTQRTLVSGNIFLSFPNVKDYNGNKITGTTTIRYVGNIDIPITVPSVDANGVSMVNPTHGGLSGGTGYSSLDISWYYSYTPPASNPGTTVYSVKRTTGSQDCKDPAALDISSLLVSPSPAAGAVTAYDGTDATTRANTTHKFTLSNINAALPYPGSAISYTVLICVDNDANNKHGKVALNIIRADSAPATTVSQGPGSFATPKTLAFSCSPFMDKIAINTGATNDNATDPTAAVNPPSFNASTGAITAGTQYDSAAPWQTTYTTDPTWSAYKFSCIDQAGNIEAVKTKSIYKVDSRFPSVTITNVYNSGTTVSVTGASTAVGAYNNIDIIWKTNIANTNWEMRLDGAACGSSSPYKQSPPTTPAAANSLITTSVAASALTTGANQVTLCVYSSGVGAWGQDSVTVVRDDSVPTISFNIGAGSYGSLQSIVPTCSTNGDKIIYSMASLAGGTAPTPPSAPTFDTNGQLATGSTFGAPLVPADGYTTTYVFRCINKGGVVNAAPVTATYKIDSVLPTITIVSNSRDYLSNVAGYTGTSLVWQSSRGGLSYFIKQPGTACGGTALSAALPGNSNVAGTTPTDTSQTITTTIDKANFGADGSYAIQICVQNYISQWGYTSKSLVVDTALPTFAGLTSIALPASGSATLSWSAAATDAGSGVAFYRVYQRTSLGAYGAPDYTVPYPNNSFTVTGLSPTTIYFFKVYAVDNAGNEQTTPTVEYKTGINLNVAMSGFGGIGTVTVKNTNNDSLTFTSNVTQTLGTPMASGQTYGVYVQSQPVGQYCAFVQKQFGTAASSDITLQLKCVNGYSVSENVRPQPAAKLSYSLYQGTVSFIAGSGGMGSSDGTGAAASFQYPEYLAFYNGDIFVGDSSNSRIRRVTASSGLVGTLAGRGYAAANTSADDGTCADTGSSTTAKFRTLTGVATDGTNIYVAEWENGRIRKISDINGTCSVTTLAGTGVTGDAIGPAGSAQFNTPRQLALLGDTLFVADTSNNKIKRITLSTGNVDILIGSGAAADAAGTGTAASINSPYGLTVIGNKLYASSAANRIFEINLSTAVATIVAGSGNAGHADGVGTAASFDGILSLTNDGSDLYLVETANHTIRRVEISRGYRVSTLAGFPKNPGATNGTGGNARFNVPHGITSDGRNFYIANHTGQTIVKMVDNGLQGFWPLAFGNLNDYNSANAFGPHAVAFASTTDSSTADRLGAAGQATLFAGAESVTAVNTGLVTGTTARSICAWAKPTAQPTGSNAIIASFGGASNDNSFGIYISKTTVSNQLGITTFGGATDILSNQPLVLNEWSHVCATFAGSGAGSIRRLYLNGKLLLQDTLSTNVSLTGGVTIGGQQGGFDYFTGGVADVRIYNRALNEGEINDLSQDATQAGVSYSTGGTGLLAHYEFNNPVWLLPSGPVGGNLGSLGSNPIGIHGDGGGAFYYDGSTNNGSTGYGLPAGNSPRTLCIWIKPQVSQSNRVLVAHGTAAVDRGFGISLETNGITMWSYGHAKSLYSYAPKLNTWQHVCGSFDGANGTVYVDGVALGTQTIVGPIDSAGSSITIGSNLGGGNIYQGTLDDVRIYNNALSAAQIRQLATLVPAGLVFRMDTNGDATDVSGYGATLASNTGSLTSGRAGIANTAYAFSSGQFASFNHNQTLMGQKDMTWSFWLKSRNLGSLGTEIFTKYQSTPTAGWVFKYDQSNYPHGWTYGASGTATIAKGSRINSNNVWNHITFVRSGATMTVYQNGASIAIFQAGDTSAISQNTVPMKIGSVFTGDLMVQDARLYSRALSVAEIQTLSGYHVHQSSAGLKMHLQADTFSDLPDGSLTGNWLDSAPDPYDLNYPSANSAQAVVTGSPVMQTGSNGINGMPAVGFDGSTIAYYSYGGGNNISYSGATVCSVFTRKTSGSGYRGLFEKRSTTLQGNAIALLNDTSLAQQLIRLEKGGSVSTSATVADATPAIFCAVHSAPSSLAPYLNGTSGLTTTTPVISGTNTDPLFVGTRYVTPHTVADQYAGLISEIILTVKDSSTTELKVTQCYLSAKYGIALDNSVICP